MSPNTKEIPYLSFTTTIFVFFWPSDSHCLYFLVRTSNAVIHKLSLTGLVPVLDGEEENMLQIHEKLGFKIVLIYPHIKILATSMYLVCMARICCWVDTEVACVRSC